MKKIFLFLFILHLSYSFGLAQVQVKNLLCENRTNPIGLDMMKPRFSWQLESDKRNVMQAAYEIRVSNDSLVFSKGNSLWNSGKVLSDQSVHVPYEGRKLESGIRYYWQVRIWDNLGKVSAWSNPGYWQMGILDKKLWRANWIGVGYKEDTVLRPSPLFRKQFSARKEIKIATAYITSHGVYEAYINGKRVGDMYLTPGWTSYHKRLQYQVYDVTSLINSGDNAIGISLGSGWYRGHLAWEGKKNIYGKDLALLVQIEMQYTDGSTDLVVTDDTWKSSTGPIKYSEIYNGELYDARDEKPGWIKAGYDDKNWAGVIPQNIPKDILVATYNEGIKKHETFKPHKIFKTPKGELVVDFGQNLVGWVQLLVKGHRGDKITLSHAEVLDKEGNFYTENLRSAKQQNSYILKSDKEEFYEPHFTFQGFRYVRVEGFQDELKPDNLTAVALYSDMKPTGSFTTSNPLINQLQHNIQWGQKGNFLDIPTDCPQRDERLGWTGDAQVFSRTASFEMNVNNFFAKWLQDVAADQLPNGSVPWVIPNILGTNSAGSAGWADAATIIPWNMYLAYGDKKIVEEQYSSMKAWVTYMEQQSKNNLWNTGPHFGDWLFYRPDDDLYGRAAITDRYLIAQTFFAHSTQLLINAARLLGKNDDVAKYTELLKKIKAAFVNEYTTSSGRLVSGSQTAFVLALNFDMLPENIRAQAAERLVQNIKSYDYHLTTGFLGTPYLCHVLSRFGYTDIAYKLLMQETYPSWLYPVKMGATTIWERWDGQKPDSTFQRAGINSFNHYAYGAIGDWLYRVVAGIDTYEEGAGYKLIKIMPHPGEGLSTVKADLQTYYGPIRSYWKQNNDQLQMEVEIPPNTKAIIFIPAKSVVAVKENGKSLSTLKDIQVIGNKNGYTSLKVGSGTYHFTAD